MEEKFLGIYKFVAVAKTRCSGGVWAEISLTRPASIMVEAPGVGARPCCRTGSRRSARCCCCCGRRSRRSRRSCRRCSGRRRSSSCCCRCPWRNCRGWGRRRCWRGRRTRCGGGVSAAGVENRGRNGPPPPPQAIISLPVQTVAWPNRAEGALVSVVAVPHVVGAAPEGLPRSQVRHLAVLSPPSPAECMVNILVERSRLIRQIRQVAAGRGDAVHVQIKGWRRPGFCLSGEGYMAVRG
jgi:hypothetical protein